MVGASFTTVGEHVAGCGWVACRRGWAVYQARSWTAHYYRNLAHAYAEAERLLESHRRCSLPVRAWFCRLLKRHEGPSVPWD